MLLPSAQAPDVAPLPILSATTGSSPPTDKLAGSGASSVDEDKKHEAGVPSYETTLEADELSLDALHVYDNDKLRE